MGGFMSEGIDLARLGEFLETGKILAKLDPSAAYAILLQRLRRIEEMFLVQERHITETAAAHAGLSVGEEASFEDGAMSAEAYRQLNEVTEGNDAKLPHDIASYSAEDNPHVPAANLPIDELRVSALAKAALKNAGLETIGDVLAHPDLSLEKGIGAVFRADILAAAKRVTLEAGQ